MFDKMQYVYEVYREMSFSRAAKNLFISQPSLSCAVKKVEDEIGFPIFDRTTNPIRLTELGRKYIHTAEQIMALESGFRNYLDDIEALSFGTLSLGATTLYASHILPPLLARFTRRYPSVHIDLIEDSSSDLTAELSSGALDLLIENTELDPLLYEKKFYCHEQILLAVPRSFACNAALQRYALSADDIKRGLHTEDRTPAVPLHALADEPFLLLKSGNDTRLRADRICREAELIPNIRLEVAQQMTSYNLTCHGMGISFIGDLMVKNVESDPSLLFYRLQGTGAQRDVCFFYRRNRYISHAIRAFLSLLEQTVSHESSAV